MNWFNLVYLLIALLYLASAVIFLGGAYTRRERLRRLATWLAIAGFVLHTLVLIHFLATGTIQTLSRGYFIKLLSWSIVLAFFLLWWRMRLQFLALTAAPLALLLFISSFTISDAEALMPEALSGLFFGLHIGAIFLSMGLMAMAFGAGLVFLRMDRKIKSKEKLSGFQKDLPALATFDKVNHWAALVGFPLFTVGLISGFIWARFTWGKVITWDPKEVVSIFVWLVYAFWFHQRVFYGWRGRKPASLAVWVFFFSILSLVGINYFLPTHHTLVR